MFSIGLTGGIASGKSTLAILLSNLIPLVHFDADTAVHDLLANDPEVKQQLVKAFGENVLTRTEEIDRAFLRENVFASLTKKTILEGILHPMVRKKWRELQEELRARQERIIFLADIPLLYETESEQYFDEVVVVACGRDHQMQRLAARGLSPQMAIRIIEAQWPTEKKCAAASRVIWNDGSPTCLQAQATLLSQKWIDHYGN